MPCTHTHPVCPLVCLLDCLTAFFTFYLWLNSVAVRCGTVYRSRCVYLSFTLCRMRNAFMAILCRHSGPIDSPAISVAVYMYIWMWMWCSHWCYLMEMYAYKTYPLLDCLLTSIHTHTLYLLSIIICMYQCVCVCRCRSVCVYVFTL